MPERRSAWQSSARSSTATPVVRRPIRARAATGASASRSCSRSRGAPAPRRLATGHYARIVEHRGRLLLARAADPDKDQSYMLARLDPRHLDRLWFPLGEQSKEETRAEAERAGPPRSRAAPRARRRASSAGPTTASSSSATGCRLGRGGSSTRPARRSAATTVSGGSRPASAAASASRPVSRPTRLGSDPATNTVVVGSRESLARRTVAASGRLFASVTRGDAKLRYRSPALPADVEPTEDGFRLLFDEPAYGVAAGQTAVVYEGDAVVGSGTIASSAP